MPPGDFTRQARLAGLRPGASLEDVQRRRFQLWAVMSVLLVTVSLLVAVSAVWPDTRSLSVVPPRVLQFGMVALSLGFSAYVFEKERCLQRLTTLLVDERVARETVTRHVRKLEELIVAGRNMTASLERERVVDLVLDHALELVDAKAGSVLLSEKTGLELAASRGDGAVRLATDGRRPVLHTVRHERQPELDERGMSVPLIHQGRLLGVLAVSAGEADFSEMDLSILDTFGEYAAAALANALQFEEERAEVVRYRLEEEARQEFRWLVR